LKEWISVSYICAVGYYSDNTLLRLNQKIKWTISCCIPNPCCNTILVMRVYQTVIDYGAENLELELIRMILNYLTVTYRSCYSTFTLKLRLLLAFCDCLIF